MLKELRIQHRNIIQMAFSGYLNKEIAARLDLSEATVGSVIRSPLGQAYLNGLQDKSQEATIDVRKKLLSLNNSALSVLERVMNPAEKAPHSVQLTAAKDVLDRTGYKAPDRLHVDMTLQTKTDAEIEAEIEALRASAHCESLPQTHSQKSLQVPSTETSFDEFDAFTNEPQDSVLQTEDQDTSDLSYLYNEAIDSSDITLNNQSPNQQTHDLSENNLSEESMALLSKIPPNIFQQPN